MIKIKMKSGSYVGRSQGFKGEDEVIGKPGKIYKIARIVQDAKITTDKYKESTVKLFVEMEEVI